MFFSVLICWKIDQDDQHFGTDEKLSCRIDESNPFIS